MDSAAFQHPVTPLPDLSTTTVSVYYLQPRPQKRFTDRLQDLSPAHMPGTFFFWTYNLPHIPFILSATLFLP